jgi:hypothetical protein
MFKNRVQGIYFQFSQDLNQPAVSQLELQRKRPGTGLTEIIKNIERVDNWTQRGKGTHTRALWQKNERSLKVKQRPVKMGGRSTYRTLSPKRAPFQIGID